jgi:hypothetical protein
MSGTPNAELSARDTAAFSQAAAGVKAQVFAKSLTCGG